MGLCCLGLSGILELAGYFLPHFRDIFDYYLFKYFLMTSFFVFFFSDTYGLNVGAFNIVPEVSKVVLISFLFFFLLSSTLSFSSILSSSSLILSSASVILLFIPSRVFLI